MEGRSWGPAFALALAVGMGMGMGTSSCAGTRPPPAGPPRTPAPKPVAVPALAWPFWEPVERALHPSPRVVDLPLDEAVLDRPGGADMRWRLLGEGVRSDVLDQGFAVRPDAPHLRIGDVYAEAARDGTPILLTLDALFFFVHLARERALADVETRVLGPAMRALLGRLTVRLAGEERGARTDLLSGYRLARELVAVALALCDPGRPVPAELKEGVEAEMALIAAHAGPAPSPLLGLTVDYSLFAARGGLHDVDAEVRDARAAVWLAEAPLALRARSEPGGEGLPVGTVRTHARAALLVARLLSAGVDADARQAWTTIATAAELAVGPIADVSPMDLAQAAASVGLDVHDTAAIADVVRLDRARHAMAARRPGANVRLLGLRDVPDADVMGSLVAPFVPHRALPSNLDVAAWLGSDEARVRLHDIGADAFSGYEARLQRLYQQRPREEQRHTTFYRTALDAIAAFLAPSSCDGGLAASPTNGWHGRKLTAALSAWTELRHDSVPYARVPLVKAATPPPPHLPTPTLVLVEPHPEAIGRLLAHTRQIENGLSALRSLPPDAPSRAILAEVDALLTLALDASVRQANEQPLGAELARAMAAVPQRILALEARVSPVGADEVAMIVDVHTDLASASVLEEATGRVNELYVAVRMPGTVRPTLAMGASLEQREEVVAASGRLSDAAWRVRLREGPSP